MTFVIRNRKTDLLTLKINAMRKFIITMLLPFYIANCEAQLALKEIPTPRSNMTGTYMLDPQDRLFCHGQDNDSMQPFWARQLTDTTWEFFDLSLFYPYYGTTDCFDSQSNLWGNTSDSNSRSYLFKYNGVSRVLYPYPIGISPSSNLIFDYSNNLWFFCQIQKPSYTTYNEKAHLVKFDGINWSTYRLIDYDSTGWYTNPQSYQISHVSRIDVFPNGNIKLNTGGASFIFTGNSFYNSSELSKPLGFTPNGNPLYSGCMGSPNWQTYDTCGLVERDNFDRNAIGVFGGKKYPLDVYYGLMDSSYNLFSGDFNYWNGKFELHFATPSVFGGTNLPLRKRAFSSVEPQILYDRTKNRIILAGVLDSSISNQRIVSLSLDSFYNQPILLDPVWPGDANSDGTADNSDLLNIGLAYGDTGIIRISPDTYHVWLPHAADLWSQNFATNINYKHADCDGNGIINADDTTQINSNYSLIHAKKEEQPAPWRSGKPTLNIVLSKDTVRDGDTLFASIQLGDMSTPVNNIYGLAFTFNFDAKVVDTNQLGLIYKDSWFATSTERLTLTRGFNEIGQIKTAVTRINHAARSGYGEIAEVAMIITTDNINGKDLAYYNNIVFISSVTAVDSSGNEIDLNEGIDSAWIEFEPTVISEIQQFDLQMHPNPASKKLFVKSSDALLKGIKIRNVIGAIMREDKLSNEHKAELDLSDVSNGVYLIEIETNKGTAVKRVLISK